MKRKTKRHKGGPTTSNTVEEKELQENQDAMKKMLLIQRGHQRKDMVHIYNGILLSHKKNEIMLFAATWMVLEIIIPGEVSQKKTNTIYITYVC